MYTGLWRTFSSLKSGQWSQPFRETIRSVLANHVLPVIGKQRLDEIGLAALQLLVNDRHPALWQAAESLLHPFLRRRHRPFPHHFSFAVGHIVVAALVAEVHADRNRSLAGIVPLRTRCTSVILLHSRFSFLHPECVSIGSLT